MILQMHGKVRRHYERTVFEPFVLFIAFATVRKLLSRSMTYLVCDRLGFTTMDWNQDGLSGLVPNYAKRYGSSTMLARPTIELQKSGDH